MKDYSQGGEQAAILSACEGITGAFLDIGAFCATSLSNTRALYELGWGGVMIDPSPGPIKGLLQEYGNDPRVKVVCAAVGLDRHIVKFRITDDAVSTSEAGNEETWKTRGGFYGSLWVPEITLAEIINQFGGFDFVNIDTEGTSVDLFAVLMATEMLPRCVCVEHDGRMIEVMRIANGRGYKMVLATGENAVFSR